MLQGIGWGGRIRTSAWRNQNPLPYRLATPHPWRRCLGPEQRGGKPCIALTGQQGPCATVGTGLEQNKMLPPPKNSAYPDYPTVDVNLFVHNGADHVAAAVESVLAQTWPAVTLTLIDDGSSDDTFAVLQGFAERHRGVSVRRNRTNVGAIGAFQRAFWLGEADFVMPKSGDDLLAPDFIARIMAVLLARPDCAMCHAAGMVFADDPAAGSPYPAQHALLAVNDDPVERACAVMRGYTTSPSFWGIYRRDAVDRLAPIRFRAGWDHALLAELALHGEIRHVPATLYYRRRGGKPVHELARASTEQGTRGLSPDNILADQSWRTPLITTALVHLEAFAAARVTAPRRVRLMQMAPAIFRARWLPHMRHEATGLRAALPALMAPLRSADPTTSMWIARNLSQVVRGVETVLPDEDFTLAHLEIAALAGETRRHAA